jgi:S-adenosylmethionine:tRNA ribosyltransferase-isomerase
MDRVGLMSAEPSVVRHATEPAEARGIRRDHVRMMVSHANGEIDHMRFDDLPRVLRRGDLLVVNASGTIKASLQARRSFGAPVELHLSTQLPGGLWAVEVRESTADGSKPLRLALAGEVLDLPGGGRASLLAPYPFTGDIFAPSRLWSAALELPSAVESFLDQHGAPIRYGYVPQPWPISCYQTVFATEPGSAEMPSAGRPFTDELLRTLRGSGVDVVPIVLHTGVSSLEDHEPPYEERFHVSRRTAAAVNAARRAGGRIMAVGTTSVRALETVTDELGVTHPGRGWTDLVIDGQHPLRAVTGLLTGLHEPRASHLLLIQALLRRWESPGGRHAIDRAYEEAIAREYLWHEFGDTHLILGSDLGFTDFADNRAQNQQIQDLTPETRHIDC